MRLENGGYVLAFMNGGVEVRRDGKLLYFNRRPMFVTVKTAFAVNEFYDRPYDEVAAGDGRIIARGLLAVPTGSAFAFTDTYETAGTGFKVSRHVKVVRAADDLGFSTKISFTMAASEDPRDYWCFAPGVWYKQNEFAPDTAIGKDLSCEYFWRMETCYALPLFAMMHIRSGETAALSRWAADVTMPSTDILRAENHTDPKCTTGAIGMSRPESRTLNYMYYGFAVRKPLETKVDGLSIDYVYPGCDGELPSQNRFLGLDYRGRVKSFRRVNHPVEEGFEQRYAVGVRFGRYDDFYRMMRDNWRVVYERLRDRLFEVDNERHFHNCMKVLARYTRKYGDAYGLPFAAQLPHMDISTVSFQFGFVGQQPGIGYLLLRYGDMVNDPEIRKKGIGILDFWTRTAMTESGLPHMCYNPNIRGFEPYPHYVRMLADGIEAILDAFLYLRERGEERRDWLAFCRKAADWLTAAQNGDGSFYRAYNTDGSVRMDSKANTPSVIRFLVRFHLVTGEEKYRTAALRAGEWAYEHNYRNLEYRGGTCDNLDIMDKEAGIYALFGFLALYDLTGEKRWLEAAAGAADYTETWVYAWSFPVRTPWPKHPFNRHSISGQSIITIGGGADVYMAACSYTYYRLYLLTGDAHYRDVAEFLHKNTRQSTDVDGSIGYAMPGIGHESGNFASQTLQSHYHWLPWCTFVQAEPILRLHDAFGVWEIADAEKLPPEERMRRNRDHAFPIRDAGSG